MPPVKTAHSAAISSNFPGAASMPAVAKSNRRPAEAARHVAGSSERIDALDCPVDIWRRRVPGGAGADLYDACRVEEATRIAGSVPLWSVNVPGNPLAGVITEGNRRFGLWRRFGCLGPETVTVKIENPRP